MELFKTSTNAALAHADAGDAYQGVRLTRTIGMIDDTVLVIDRAAGDDEHTYDWVFHNRGELTTTASMQPFAGKLGEPEPYQVPRDIRTLTTAGPFTGVFTLKEIAVPFRLHLDRQTRLFSAVAPGNPPTEMVPMLLARQRGKTAVFAWAFAITKNAGAALEIEKAPGHNWRSRLS